MSVNIEWAVARLAAQAKQIRELKARIVQLERELHKEIDTSELEILETDEFNPMDTGTFRALNYERSRK